MPVDHEILDKYFFNAGYKGSTLTYVGGTDTYVVGYGDVTLTVADDGSYTSDGAIADTTEIDQFISDATV